MWPFTSQDKNDVIKNALKKAKKSGKPEPIEGKDNHFMWKNGIEAVKQPNGRYKILKNHNKDIKGAMAKLRAKASAARKAKATGRKESKAKAAEKVLKAFNFHSKGDIKEASKYYQIFLYLIWEK